jgi:proline dehydrogenase
MLTQVMRRLLLFLSTAAWARGMVTRLGAARQVALRFVAGETLQEAYAVTQALNAKGLAVTLDYLGESVARAEDTQEVVKTYQALLDQIHTQQYNASVSLKLTHLGLDISEDLCVTNLRHILTQAKAHGIGVTIDMESSAYVDRTLRIYRTLRDEYEFENVGTVIQSYLYRSESDMRELAAEGSHIRLVKGAYLEAPDVAFPEKADVDANYIRLMRDYLQAPQSYLCIATQDEAMIQAAEQIIGENTIPRDRYEFQMLYGIRTARQEELARAGYTMRVYLPFGAAWYPYFMRRLAERPANLKFFLRALFQR